MQDSPERSPIANASISVVLLAPQENAEWAEALASWVALLDGRDQGYEILLVYGSRVPAENLGENLQARYPHVRSMRSPTGTGLGAALRVGLAAARHPLLFCTTCDRHYQPSDLALLLKWIDQTDLVSGSRAGPSGSRWRPWRESVYRWLVRLLFAVRLQDVNCWFFLARRSIFGRIPIQSDGVFAQAEVLAKANFLGCLMTDVPVSYGPPPLGKSPPDWKLAELARVFFHPDFGPAVFADLTGAVPAPL